MNAILASLVSLGFLFLASGSLKADSLVLNGDFETGDFTQWTITNAANGSLLTVSPFVPHLGTYAAAFGATESEFDAIQQNLSTTPGQMYVLSFWVDLDAQGEPSNDFQVYWNNTLLEDLRSLDTSTGAYIQYSVSVPGTGTDILKFQGYNAASNDYLDDISVVAAPPLPGGSPTDGGTPGPANVPEPVTVALSSTALLMLGIRKKFWKQ
jgi:hypothetical protein